MNKIKNHQLKLEAVKTRIMKFIFKKKPFKFTEVFEEIYELPEHEKRKFQKDMNEHLRIDNFYDQVNHIKTFHEYSLVSRHQLKHMNSNPHNIDV